MKMAEKMRSYLSPHDRYQKAVLSEIPVAKEFFEVNVPPFIKEVADFSALEHQNTSFISKKLKLKIADILYKVDIQVEGGKEPGYLLVEHTSTVDNHLAYRVIRYMIEVADFHMDKKGYKDPPFIYPIVLYTGAQKFTASLNFFDRFLKHKDRMRDIFNHSLHLVDLHEASDEQIKRDYSLFAGAAYLAKHIHTDNILNVLVPGLELVRDVARSKIVDYTELTLHYLAETAQIPDSDTFAELVTKVLTNLDKEEFMRTLAEQWKQEERVLAEQREKIALEAERKKIALSLLSQDLAVDFIATATGLTVEQVEDLRTVH